MPCGFVLQYALLPDDRSLPYANRHRNLTMSVKVMGRVWDANLEPNLKIVLLAYADAAEHDGTEIWPGWERLTRMTSYSRRSVTRITAELLDLGVLVQVSKGHTGRRASYQIDLSHPVMRVGQDGPQSDLESGPSETKSGTNRAKSGTPMAPLPSSTPVLHSHPISEAATPRTVMKDSLVEAMGWNPKELTPRQWDKVEVAAKQLCDIDADPTEVQRRASVYRVNFRGATMTPIAIATNWADLAEPRIPVSQRELEDAAANMRQKEAFAELERQLALEEQ